MHGDNRQPHHSLDRESPPEGGWRCMSGKAVKR